MIASGMPQAGPPRSVRLPRSHETRLPNGLRVIASSRDAIAEALHIPLVSALLAFDRGGAYDPPKLPGTSALMLGLLRQGTARHTALELDVAIDAIGARLDRASGFDANTVGANATSAVFSQAFPKNAKNGCPLDS